MKNIFSVKYLSFLAAAAVITACEPEFDESIDEGNVYDSGEADFTKFVAVGNSLTAGFADNALYLEAQETSFPAIMAEQFELVDGGEFTQPLVANNVGGLLLNGQPIAGPRLVLGSNSGVPTGPVPFDGPIETEVTNKVTGPLNNFGVPGAKSYHLVAPGYGSVAGVPAGTANPYYARFSSSESSTVLGDAVAANGTMFTLWIGNNDILGFATSGGVGVDQTGNPDPTTYGPNDITDPMAFGGVYNALLEGLTGNGAQGVVINIPDVTSIPYFTTVPFNPLDGTDPAFGPQVPALNQFWGLLNQIFTAVGQPDRAVVFNPDGPSGVVIRDEDLVDIAPQIAGVLQQSGFPAPIAQLYGDIYGQVRQANANDLITFPSAAIIGQPDPQNVSDLVAQGLPQADAELLSVRGVTQPLTDANVLTGSERMLVANAQAAYNATIEALANQYDLAFVDAQSLLQDVASGGISFDGGVITSTYATGGAFSLDAVHPTPRGYAVIANAVIDAINEKYGSTVPGVNPGQYRTVQPSDSVMGM